MKERFTFNFMLLTYRKNIQMVKAQCAVVVELRYHQASYYLDRS